MKIAVIGAGFSGLSAAYELNKLGYEVTIFEKDSDVGGLAATFKVGDQSLEKFYHHWLGTDNDVFNLIKEINQDKKLLFKTSKVGIFYSNKIFRFSSPIDLLKFTPLSIFGRIRFGLSILYSWTIKDMSKLENISAEKWLLKVAGKNAYTTVWKPLLIGKFGKKFYKKVAAVWLWNKLIQRGKSRDRKAKEKLAYYDGGFSEFLKDITDYIKKRGVVLKLKSELVSFNQSNNRVNLTFKNNKNISFDKVIYTGHTPEFAKMAYSSGFKKYSYNLNKIDYLANICLILETNKSLSDIYWLNVNDPNFPFVGIIEHTNFDDKENYNGNYLIYLSKYLPSDDKLYKMNKKELFEYSLPYIKKMFPNFEQKSVLNYHLWKADYAQPLIVKDYKKLIPSYKTEINNLYLCTMSQVYPQDRGTNYAVYHGREIARQIHNNEI